MPEAHARYDAKGGLLLGVFVDETQERDYVQIPLGGGILFQTGVSLDLPEGYTLDVRLNDRFIIGGVFLAGWYFHTTVMGEHELMVRLHNLSDSTCLLRNGEDVLIVNVIETAAVNYTIEHTR